MRERVANLTSNILNPHLVGILLILLLSLKSTSSVIDAVKWLLISIAVTILPVFGVTIYLVHSQKLENVFINVRKQRTKFYLLVSVCGSIGYIVFLYLEAPPVLIATFVAGLSAVVVFMCINFM
ncbi:hypothetical protein ACFLV9_00460 [Chloroflexota bacterium]